MMGIGKSFKVKLVTSGEQQGVDGIEPLHEEIANLWAELEYVSQSKGFDANKANYKTTYVFLIRYDSALLFDVRSMVEFNNRFYSIQGIDRGNKGRREGGGYEFIINPNGRYWRISATSQDIN